MLSDILCKTVVFLFEDGFELKVTIEAGELEAAYRQICDAEKRHGGWTKIFAKKSFDR